MLCPFACSCRRRRDPAVRLPRVEDDMEARLEPEWCGTATTEKTFAPAVSLPTLGFGPLAWGPELWRCEVSSRSFNVELTAATSSRRSFMAASVLSNRCEKTADICTTAASSCCSRKQSGVSSRPCGSDGAAASTSTSFTACTGDGGEEERPWVAQRLNVRLCSEAQHTESSRRRATSCIEERAPMSPLQIGLHGSADA